MPDDPLIVALALERMVRELPGVAGLDPSSRLATRTGAVSVRGAWMRPEPENRLSMELELVGLEGARLVAAADEARRLAGREAAEHGWTPGRVDVTLTDVAQEPLPLQEEIAPQPAHEGPPQPAHEEPPPPRPAAPATTARVELAGTDRRTVLVITVEVAEERA